jgi:hypothetical protein
MATGTVATTARKMHYDVVHYVSCPIVYTTLSYTVGMLPAGAVIVDAGVIVTTAFAGGTPQTLDIGANGDADGLATALVITSAGRKAADELATSDDLYITADSAVTATLSAGATVTAGAGYVYVSYIIANRGA